MWSSLKALRVLISFLLVAVLSITALADTIRLKDGSRIKGKIVAFGARKFTINVGDGTRKRQMSFDVDDIDSIIFESTPPPVSNTNAAVVTTNYPTKSTTPPKQQPVQTAQTKKQPVRQEPASDVNNDNDPPKQSTASNSDRRSTANRPKVELSINVLADNTANGWTNSGWVVKKGQRIRIVGTGEVSLGRGKTTGPSGLYDVDDKDKLLKSVPTGALIAVIGDDNNEFIYIGSEREFTASRDGALFLGLNEGNLNDNSGSFSVKIEISPDGGS